jgi:2-keto-4-pentenoate hydratase/2-oxohepta-3-ene-1,7-dioic acid hydratase in catechol pathway
MQLLPFATHVAGVGRRTHLGALVSPTTVVDLRAAAVAASVHAGLPVRSAERIADGLVPVDVSAFVANGERGLAEARHALDWQADAGDAVGPTGAQLTYQLADVLRLPAVPEPSLIRDFMAFEQHLLNIFPKLGRDIPPVWYEIPVYYKGNPAAVGAHLQAIVIPDYAGDELDFEFEIAAVIGRGGRDISEETALDHVYGYTIYDDFSARAMQSREMSVGLGPAKGKDFDGAHVLGPVLVTADEIPDPYDLAMTARVNDEEWTTGSTGAMHWRFEQMIAHASRAETLRPAEVFGSGTVGGGSAAEVGRTLHAGDVVELTVERLGTLTNAVVGHDIVQ